MDNEHVHSVLDLTLPGIDLIFRDNNCIYQFLWSDDRATIEYTLKQVLTAIHILTDFFWSDIWEVRFSEFEYDIPLKNEEKYSISSEGYNREFERILEALKQKIGFNGRTEGVRSLNMFQAIGHGWCRIAIPQEVSRFDGWRIVGDGIFRKYEIQPAPPLYGVQTVWIRLLNTLPMYEISLVVEMTGEIRIIFNLGNTFYNSESDPRNSLYLIQGVPLCVWQEKNSAILENALSKMKCMGWQISSY